MGLRWLGVRVRDEGWSSGGLGVGLGTRDGAQVEGRLSSQLVRLQSMLGERFTSLMKT